jgi:hypothetical protein
MTFLCQKDFKGDRKLSVCATRINENKSTYLLLLRQFDTVGNAAAYFELYYGCFGKLLHIIGF